MAASCFANLRTRNFLVKILLLLAFAVQVLGRGNKTNAMIYQKIVGLSPCVRRMNATHQIGCSSDFHGNTGVIHLIENASDIDWVTDIGPHAPYIILFTADMFTRPNIEKLVASKKVSGIVVDHSNETRRDVVDTSDGYSTDRSCPNDNFGLYNETEYAGCPSVKWNPHGDGSNFEVDFGVPILSLYYIEEIDFILECYEMHNKPNGTKPAMYPLCALELNDFMVGVKDTPTCMWRTQRVSNLELNSFCDPIGDQNVWGYAKNSNDTESSNITKSIILAAAQLDATSLFYSAIPRVGSESVVSSFVPLLAAAEAIGNIAKEKKDSWIHDVMFVFFNAESYEYSGSSRMVFDMMRGYFPTSAETIRDSSKEYLPQMNVTDISYFLELRQLGLSNGTYYAHVDPISQMDADTKNKTDELITVLQSFGDIEVNTTQPNTPLPPASFQQFLKTGINIPGVVLTDHEKEFENRFYNSRYDYPYSVGIDDWNNETEIIDLAMKLNKVAETVAKTLVSLAGGDESSVTTDVTTVNRLLYCFLVKSNCTLLMSLHDDVDAKLSPIAVDLYTGVEVLDTQGSILTNRLLAYYLGEKTVTKEADKKDCSQPDDNEVFNYQYVLGPKMNSSQGICIKSTVHITPAVSPAFIDDEDTTPDWASTKYSTWTESQWSNGAFSIRVFLVPSPEQEWVIFSLGLVIVLVSFPSVYFINSRADVLFRADASY